MDVPARIEALRKQMEKHGVDAYLVPTADYHQSEYVGEFFKARAWLSGFRGSAGTLLVFKDNAALWTDGRYFLAAEGQLAGSGIRLMKMGTEGVPTVEAYLLNQLVKGQVLGFDGRVVSAQMGNDLKAKLEEKGVWINAQLDLVDVIWEERPARSCEPIWLLSDELSGESRAIRLQRVRAKMAELKADVHVLTGLDDIAWLMNMRGNDVAYNPVALSFAVIAPNEAILYIDSDAVSQECAGQLAADGVQIRPYLDFYEELKAISGQKCVLLDRSKIGFAVEENLSGAKQILNKMNPTTLMKAIKNETELKNLHAIHVRDGVAFTKFMYWLKNSVGKQKITEIDAQNYLAERRLEQEGSLGLSFESISAYQENAAMMHYSAGPESNAEIKPEGLYLIDSGGQYMGGTTDITRTMAMGSITDVQRKHFTAVLRSMLNLQSAKFLHGCTGINLDILARGPIWDLDLDYRSGTGHGIGYMLNVHEGPNGFRWRQSPDRTEHAILEPGMVTTDEPGIYLDGQYGIRTENELVCCKGELNEYGQFLHFEPLTYAPIDLDAVDPKEMGAKEKRSLNDYHRKVYELISPHLGGAERAWLKEYTREI